MKKNVHQDLKLAKVLLTVLLDANANGDFKLKLLIIYLSENPRAIKKLSNSISPVFWEPNKNSKTTLNIDPDFLLTPLFTR